MIGYLKGRVISVESSSIILDVNGVGYEIFLAETSVGIGSEIELYIYTHVREDQLKLYGFSNKESMLLFKQLIAVSGVGPKVGQAILSELGSDKASFAIAAGDALSIKSVSGVGKKIAERIVLELKTKVVVLPGLEDLESGGVSTEAVNALCDLGFERTESAKLVSEVLESDSGLAVEEIIKKALSKK